MAALLLPVLMVCITPALVTSVSYIEGTTPNIKSVFVGRCNDYNAFRVTEELPRVTTSCDDLWTFFHDAFAYKPECNSTQENYAAFVEHAGNQSLPRDKVIFWEGTYPLVLRYSQKGQRHVAMEDTLLGHIMDTLVWCSQVDPPGMNFTACPDWGGCPGDEKDNFWAAASKSYASRARGEVTALLTGSDPNQKAYWRTSFFALYELPNLNVNEVTKFNAILMHDLDKPKLETCASESLQLLKEDVKARGLEFSCVDDPPEVMHMLCSDNPSSQDCQEFHAQAAGQQHCNGNSATRMTSSLATSGSLISVFVVFYTLFSGKWP